MKEQNNIQSFLIPLLEDSREGKIIMPKSERLLTPLLGKLAQNNIELSDLTRQRKQYKNKEVLLTRPRDALTFMKIQGAMAAITSIDGLIEWAGANGYYSNQSFLEQYDILKLGLVFCTVELTCLTTRTDLIKQIVNAKSREDIGGVLLREQITIPTDTPWITRKLFPGIPITELGGGVEIACTEKTPIGIGVVEKGTSIQEEGFYRFDKDSPAVLLQKSQLCLVTRKDQYVN